MNSGLPSAWRFIVRVVCFLIALAACAAEPAIDIISISPFGAVPGRVEGVVSGMDSQSHKIVPYIFLSGLGYYSKPTCAAPTIAIALDGTFTVPFTTGGVDDLATRIALFVIPVATPVECTISSAGVPEPIERAAVASVIVRRPDPNEREITFAGEAWAVKTNRVPIGPGANLFSDGTDNVFLDADKRLHLKITQRDGRGYSAEVVSRRTVAYGTYTFTLASAPRIDPAAVFGAFVWADGERDSREIDFLEIGMFGRPPDGTNAQYVVQPFSNPNNLNRLTLPDAPLTTHSVRWEPQRVTFASFLGTTMNPSAQIASWTFAGRVPRADSPNLNFRFNLWLYQGPPTDGRDVEVIIQDFHYQPLPDGVPRPGANQVSNGASFLPSLAPGAIFSVFGKNLAPHAVVPEGVPLPLVLAETSVTVNGLPAPLFYVSPEQINGQIPYATPLGAAQVVVRSDGVSSDPVTFPLTSTGPGVFGLPPNICLAQNADLSLNSQANPARPGSFVTAYLTGIGVVSPLIRTGEAAPTSPLHRPVADSSARLDQESIELQFLGLAPGFVGVGQANVIIPATTPGAARTLTIRVGSADSNPCLLFVGNAPVAIPAPSIRELGPRTGSPGHLVEIIGENFQPGASVRFGPTQSLGVTFVNSSLLRATVPSGSGTVTATVTNPDGVSATLAGAFQFAAPEQPSITASLQACSVAGTLIGGLSPENYRIVVWARTNMFYIQPCDTEGTQTIRNNRSWGPIDSHDGEIWVMLVRNGYLPPATASTLPAVDGVNVLAVRGPVGSLGGCDVARCPAR